MITHILKKCKDTVFVGVKTYETTTLTTIDNKSKNKTTKEKELEQYLKYYQYFAYLRLNKICNLYKVTTLQKKIKISKDLDICNIYIIIKMRNRILKQLSIQLITILDLIQFNIVELLLATIYRNRQFLLIINICLRRDWVLPLKHKGDTY